MKRLHSLTLLAVGSSAGFVTLLNAPMLADSRALAKPLLVGALVSHLVWLLPLLLFAAYLGFHIRYRPWPVRFASWLLGSLVLFFLGAYWFALLSSGAGAIESWAALEKHASLETLMLAVNELEHPFPEASLVASAILAVALVWRDTKTVTETRPRRVQQGA